VRILGVDPAFDGVTVEADVTLLDREPTTGGDADLFVHQVDASDGFGDRMLDLKAGVHLDEIELAIFVEEFDRAGARIA
jgi:hypothetical protein